MKITGWHRMSNLLDTGVQNDTCQNLTICDAKLYTHYQYSLPTLREFKWEMDNMSVYFL